VNGCGCTGSAGVGWSGARVDEEVGSRPPINGFGVRLNEPSGGRPEAPRGKPTRGAPKGRSGSIQDEILSGDASKRMRRNDLAATHLGIVEIQILCFLCHAMSHYVVLFFDLL
jgi:hypothetical protein